MWRYVRSAGCLPCTTSRPDNRRGRRSNQRLHPKKIRHILFAYYGEPVMIPGSMGSSSYLLRGLGNPDALWSASHGAGRKKSRGDAIKGNDEEFRRFMERFHIITPIDPARSDLKGECLHWKKT